ncbi:hypothetical protein [Massilia sp. METH4]|uniref:hypothetical protein n=1 Tax=Massilia sp. METH4 TaxID=3123041 RepID=UPI0030CC3AA0
MLFATLPVAVKPELFMFIEQEIDADALAAICLSPEDFEEAAEALLLLERKNRPLAGKVALEVLTARIGDIYYRAHAFDVLYSAALEVAIEYIEMHASTESVYVLGTMLESVMEDSSVFEGRDKILKAVSLLRKAVGARPQDELDSIAEQIALFEVTYKYG